jgi:hypothetical protein
MAIRYVNPSGSNTSPYDTEAKAATTIQTAITGASAGDIVAIRNDSNYVITSAISLTQSVYLVGYQTSPPTAAIFDGDMSRGGAFYGTRIVIDTDGGAFPALQYAADYEVGIVNIRILPLPTTQVPLDLVTNTTVATASTLFVDNCSIEGGSNIDLLNMESTIVKESRFIGTWRMPDGKSFTGVFTNASGAAFYNNFFKADEAEGYINFVEIQLKETMNIAFGNIFTMGATASFDKEMIRTVHGGVIHNNVFYQPAGALLGQGTTGAPRNAAIGMVTAVSTRPNTSIFNNIFQSDASGASRMNGIWADEVTNHSSDNCLYNVLNDNYTLTATDVTVDPLFEDPPNDDFTLKPGSPMFNDGYPSLAGDGIFGESTIGSYQRGLVDNNELYEDGVNLTYGKSNKQYGP